MGNYNYHSSKRNRLLTVGAYSMSYDSNGNIINDGNARTFSYYSFDKVKQITKGSLYSEFKYGANRARYYKKDKRTENGLNTYYYTAYVGGYEKIHRTGGGKATLTEHKVNLGNIVITSRSDGTNDEHYLHKDHLGSTISVTDKTGAVVQQFTYDPWGKQTRIYQTSVFVNLTYNQPTNRGYTGHEMIDGLDIVHMNGRIYDANIGRFMQADPNIQSVGNFQNYNRYSYVLNNPLSMTDPSGFFFKKLFKSIKKYWRAIAAVALTFVIGPYAQFILDNVLGAAFTGFIAGGVATGSLRGAVVGAISGAMFGGLHRVDPGIGKVALHGAAGGIGNVLNGGKFGHGFFAAGFTQAMGGIKGLFAKAPQGMDRLSNAIKAAVIGGTASVISGGKFASGAVTGAFSRLLNDDGLTTKAEKRKIKLNKWLSRLNGAKDNGLTAVELIGSLDKINAAIQTAVSYNEFIETINSMNEAQLLAYNPSAEGMSSLGLASMREYTLMRFISYSKYNQYASQATAGALALEGVVEGAVTIFTPNPGNLGRLSLFFEVAELSYQFVD